MLRGPGHTLSPGLLPRRNEFSRSQPWEALGFQPPALGKNCAPYAGVVFKPVGSMCDLKTCVVCSCQPWLCFCKHSSMAFSTILRTQKQSRQHPALLFWHLAKWLLSRNKLNFFYMPVHIRNFYKRIHSSSPSLKPQLREKTRRKPICHLFPVWIQILEVDVYNWMVILQQK